MQVFTVWGKWKDIRSAMRYIDAPDVFSQRRIEQALAAGPLGIPGGNS